MSRRASIWNKRDQVERSILQAYARLGVSVHEGGPLDLWVWLGKWVPAEEKSGNAPLTKGQQEFVAECEHLGRPYLILRSAADAVKSVLEWRARA